MDRDVKAPGHDDGQAGYRWRSKEVERQLALEVSGVMDAARHPQHGRAANLKKTLAICVVALAAVGVMVTAGILQRDSPENGSLAVIASAPEDEARITAIGVPSAQAAAEVLDNLALAAFENEPAAPSEPNRANCDSIRGTAYLSESERTWFLTSCAIEPEPPVFLAAPSLGGVVTEPAATGTTATGASTEDAAIASGAAWMAIQPDGVYEVAAEGCNATQLGGVWLITCEATLAGCLYEMCTSWQAVCVVESDGTIIPTKSC